MNVSQIFRDAQTCIKELELLAKMSHPKELDRMRPLLLRKIACLCPVIPMGLMILVGLSVFWVRDTGLLFSAGGMILMLFASSVAMSSQEGQLHLMCLLDTIWPSKTDPVEMLERRLARVKRLYVRLFGSNGQLHELRVLLTVPKPVESLYVDSDGVLEASLLLCEWKYNHEDVDHLLKEVGFLYIQALGNVYRFLPEQTPERNS